MGLEVIGTEGEFIRRADAPAEGRRHAHPIGADFVAGAVGLGLHQVQAEGRGVTELLVEVGCGAEIVVGAHGGGHGAPIHQHGLLGDLVDDAAGLTPTKEHGGRTAQHVDLFQVEDLPVVLGDIADAVQVEVAEGVKAPQIHAVADTAAFAGVEGEAGDVAQGVLQGVVVLLEHQLFADDGQGLGHVLGKLFRLAYPGGPTLVGLLVAGVVRRFPHLYRREGGVLRGGIWHQGGQGEAEQHGPQGQELWTEGALGRGRRGRCDVGHGESSLLQRVREAGCLAGKGWVAAGGRGRSGARRD